MFKHHVQGFAIGAAVVALVLFGIPMLSESSPDLDLDKFAGTLALGIVWTDSTPCDLKREGSTGCFTPATPNVIYANMLDNAEARRFVVLHEIGHALAHRAGVESSGRQAELDADCFAHSLGATLELGQPCQ